MKKKKARRYALDSHGRIDPIFAEFMYGKDMRRQHGRKGALILVALICVTVLINLWGYGITSLFAARDFAEFAGETAAYGLRRLPSSSESTNRNGSVYSKQKPNTADGGGYRQPGTGCPNGNRQRPDGWCPPQQREGIDGHRENVGSFRNVFIPNGSNIPVDGNGNVKQIVAGEEGSFPEGSIYR